MKEMKTTVPHAQERALLVGVMVRGRNDETDVRDTLDELAQLEKSLGLWLELLAPGGRLCVISFHSLEDRLVKQYLRREARDCLCPPRQPICTCGHKASLREVTRHPLRPQEAEVEQNRRARSARLRVAEKI